MFNTIKDFSLEAVSSLLAFFYSLPVVGGSYGIAIMLLTATVMIVLMPLTLRATRSTIKMTQLQPQLRALQKEYKDDKQELNQEMMKLYQENGVNPVGGCLPMLAQLPVFLILFNVLRGLTRRVSEKPYYTVAERAKQLSGGQVSPSNTFDPQYLDQETLLYKDLEQSTEMNFGPLDLAVDAWNVVQSDFLRSLLYILLIIFVVGSSYYQQRQVSMRRGAQPDNPTPQQQTQQQLLRILPLMSGVWSFFFPAGLVLYWATSNLFRIGQQAYITQALYSEDGPGGDAAMAKAEEAAAAKEKSLAKAKKGAESEAGELVGDGKPGKNRKANGSANGQGSNQKKAAANKSNESNNGNNGDGGDQKLSRDEAWAQRRAQRTKAQASKKKASTEGSSRTTPKGTQPSAAKKKRKR